MVTKSLKTIDWLLVVFVVPIMLFGLVTMRSFDMASGPGVFFEKQMIWIALSLLVFFSFSFLDFRFLKRTNVLVALFLGLCFVLLLLFVIGEVSKGARSWFDFGGFSFQPADLMKLALILILAKYFSRRHVEIKNVKHIFITGFYMIIPFGLILLQPDFGSAMIIFFIWFGMVLVSGISKIHLLFVFLVGILVASTFWFFIFEDYQKNRITNFLNPLADIHGSGYNAFQSTVAVGSGQIIGKGLGFGTQSRLQFLPEPETDFIFAAYSEEWGFIGSTLVLILFGLVIWRVLYNASLGATNFEILFGIGMAIYLMSHIFVNIGMNIGILPITGVPLPFMSYGGSHLMTEFMGLGILMSMRRYHRIAHKDDMKYEFLGA